MYREPLQKESPSRVRHRGNMCEDQGAADAGE